MRMPKVLHWCAPGFHGLLDLVQNMFLTLATSVGFLRVSLYPGLLAKWGPDTTSLLRGTSESLLRNEPKSVAIFCRFFSFFSGPCSSSSTALNNNLLSITIKPTTAYYHLLQPTTPTTYTSTYFTITITIATPTPTPTTPTTPSATTTTTTNTTTTTTSLLLLKDHAQRHYSKSLVLDLEKTYRFQKPRAQFLKDASKTCRIKTTRSHVRPGHERPSKPVKDHHRLKDLRFVCPGHSPKPINFPDVRNYFLTNVPVILLNLNWRHWTGSFLWSGKFGS